MEEVQHNSKKKCLLLNADYIPMKIISWKQAMIINYRNSSKNNKLVDIIIYHKNSYVAGVGGESHPIPAIIRIKKYLNLYKKPINFSRRNLFARDKYTCQYCGKKLNNNQLTYDHVIPKSRYKKSYSKSTTWTNIVTSCKVCNSKKGNKTPQEANMELLNIPMIPKYSLKYLPWYTEALIIKNSDDYSCWEPFIQGISDDE